MTERDRLRDWGLALTVALQKLQRGDHEGAMAVIHNVANAMGERHGELQEAAAAAGGR